MNLSVAVLTSRTPHHIYFARGLAEVVDLKAIVVENQIFSPAFETAHPFEIERDAYEKETLLNGDTSDLGDLGICVDVQNINSDDAITVIGEANADIVFVFGTGLLREPIMAACKGPLLNLHGGSPEEYRGLDTHLWAIYHDDFAGLVTCLHTVDSELDSGDIVGMGRLSLHRHTSLVTLRAENTKVCLDLSINALNMLDRKGQIMNRPQARRGRYYSHMPSALKEVCKKKLDRHVEKL